LRNEKNLEMFYTRYTNSAHSPKKKKPSANIIRARNRESGIAPSWVMRSNFLILITPNLLHLFKKMSLNLKYDARQEFSRNSPPKKAFKFCHVKQLSSSYCYPVGIGPHRKSYVPKSLPSLFVSSIKNDFRRETPMKGLVRSFRFTVRH